MNIKSLVSNFTVINHKQIRKFILVGMCAVVIDFSLYQIIVLSTDLPISISKGTSFICGTLFSYYFNRSWTFAYTASFYKSMLKFFTLYAITLLLNISVNSIALENIGNFQYGFYISFLLATLSSAICNFTGMKFLVFNK
jgi:putative flippase GtrA